jgi:hypothetical protein
MTLRNSDAVSRNLNNRTSVLLAGDQIEELREKFVKVMKNILTLGFFFNNRFSKGFIFLINNFLVFFAIISISFLEFLFEKKKITFFYLIKHYHL